MVALVALVEFELSPLEPPLCQDEDGDFDLMDLLEPLAGVEAR